MKEMIKEFICIVLAIVFLIIGIFLIYLFPLCMAIVTKNVLWLFAYLIGWIPGMFFANIGKIFLKEA